MKGGERMLKNALFAIALILFLPCSQSFAAIVSVVPSQQTISIGETAEFDIILGDLTVTDSQIEEYYVEFQFDNTILDYVGYDIPVSAGDISVYSQGPEYVYADVLEIVPGQQPSAGDWLLATFVMESMSAGTSQLSLNNALDMYANGTPLVIDTFVDGEINVVPIPGAFFLLLSGFGAVGLVKKLEK
jgi:hypothetical protein